MNGTLRSGTGDAAGFVAQVADELGAELGFAPFHGTLNLETAEPRPEPATVLTSVGDDHCDGVALTPCRVGGVRAAVLRPLVPGYPEAKVEVVSPVRLRSLFDIETGDSVELAPEGECWPPSELGADPDSLSSFEAVVFDLDDTLVALDVDWERVRVDIGKLLDATLDRPVRDYEEAELFELARASERYEDLCSLLREAELDGAQGARALPALECLRNLDCPVGVCTANAPAAAEQALERFDALDTVDVVVGRGSAEAEKPDPAPLSACFDRLGSAPGDGAFVGDAERDSQTAVAAGASYLHPAQLWAELDGEL